ncbi:hypothetical protein CDD81_2640 [Ophiocordyceps australis]|uniref:Uncharacterized protein n=1 Tax=Ophiocordyceps australis TaxID=1399860 RepID=A0A2C5XXN5_9HYPO|nr:hypothetical protein CDD81_2640 [Ophiocordyceps australis]
MASTPSAKPDDLVTTKDDASLATPVPIPTAESTNLEAAQQGLVVQVEPIQAESEQKPQVVVTIGPDNPNDAPQVEQISLPITPTSPRQESLTFEPAEAHQPVAVTSRSKEPLSTPEAPSEDDTTVATSHVNREQFEPHLFYIPLSSDSAPRNISSSLPRGSSASSLYSISPRALSIDVFISNHASNGAFPSEDDAEIGPSHSVAHAWAPSNDAAARQSSTSCPQYNLEEASKKLLALINPSHESLSPKADHRGTLRSSSQEALHAGTHPQELVAAGPDFQEQVASDAGPQEPVASAAGPQEPIMPKPMTERRTPMFPSEIAEYDKRQYHHEQRLKILNQQINAHLTPLDAPNDSTSSLEEPELAGIAHNRPVSGGSLGEQSGLPFQAAQPAASPATTCTQEAASNQPGPLASQYSKQTIPCTPLKRDPESKDGEPKSSIHPKGPHLVVTPESKTTCPVWPAKRSPESRKMAPKTFTIPRRKSQSQDSSVTLSRDHQMVLDKSRVLEAPISETPDPAVSASKELASKSPATKMPASKAPVRKSPSLEETAPKVSPPAVLAPKILTHKPPIPEAQVPQVSAPKVSLPESTAYKAPCRKGPGFTASAPSVTASKVPAPDVSAPKTPVPQVSAPKAPTPDVIREGQSSPPLLDRQQSKSSGAGPVPEAPAEISLPPSSVADEKSNNEAVDQTANISSSSVPQATAVDSKAKPSRKDFVTKKQKWHKNKSKAAKTRSNAKADSSLVESPATSQQVSDSRAATSEGGIVPVDSSLEVVPESCRIQDDGTVGQEAIFAARQGKSVEAPSELVGDQEAETCVTTEENVMEGSEAPGEKASGDTTARGKVRPSDHHIYRSWSSTKSRVVAPSRSKASRVSFDVLDVQDTEEVETASSLQASHAEPMLAANESDDGISCHEACAKGTVSEARDECDASTLEASREGARLEEKEEKNVLAASDAAKSPAGLEAANTRSEDAEGQHDSGPRSAGKTRSSKRKKSGKKKAEQGGSKDQTEPISEEPGPKTESEAGGASKTGAETASKPLLLSDTRGAYKWFSTESANYFRTRDFSLSINVCEWTYARDKFCLIDLDWSSMETADIIDQSLVHGGRVMRCFDELQDMLASHGAVIWRRWSQKRRHERERILCEAMPGLPEPHRPDLCAMWAQHFGNNLFTMDRRLRYLFMLPYMSREDLLQGKNLLDLLWARGAYHPALHAAPDAEGMSLGLTQNVISLPKNAKHTMFLQATQARRHYGQQVA